MVEMTHSPSTFKLGLEFNAFLFAPIAGDALDEPVSVASALARLDIDPWREAAELTLLSQEAAARRLAARLADLSEQDASPPDLGVAAARLVALLPHRPVTLRSIEAAAPTRVSMPVLLVFVAVGLITVASFAMELKSAPDQHRPAASDQIKP